MLILNETRPSISLYFLGSKLIRLMTSNRDKHFYLMDLYELFNKKSPIPFNRFMLTLDWLYAIGFINMSPEGKIYVS